MYRYADKVSILRDGQLIFSGSTADIDQINLVRLAYTSVARMAVVPLQDLMKLGTEARMNYPSRAEGNWQWRFSSPMLSREISGRLRELALLYGRCPPEPDPRMNVSSRSHSRMPRAARKRVCVVRPNVSSPWRRPSATRLVKSTWEVMSCLPMRA